MLKKKQKSYNVKLPHQFRKRFSKPFDKFVSAILTYAGDLTPDLIRNSASAQFEGAKNWMVALNSEDRTAFIKRKLEIMPYATNAQFVDALLLMHEKNSANRIGRSKGLVDYHGTQIDNTLDHSVNNGNPSKIQKRNATTNRASYKMNGIELLASPL
jgi:hypothetical protein